MQLWKSYIYLHQELEELQWAKYNENICIQSSTYIITKKFIILFSLTKWSAHKNEGKIPNVPNLQNIISSH